MGPTTYPQLPCTVFTPFGQLVFKLDVTHRGPVRHNLNDLLTEGAPATAELYFPFEQAFRIYWGWLTNQELAHIPAAGGVVVNDRGELLLIHRRGKWDLPKGKLDRGEEVEEAAIREVEEETGAQELVLDSFLCQTYHIYKAPHTTEGSKPWALKTTWWYRMSALSDTPLVPQAEEQITEVRWFTPTELEDLSGLDTHPNIRLVLSQALGQALGRGR